MEVRLLDTDLRQIFVADLNSGGMGARIQLGLDRQPGLGSGVANQIHDHLVAGQRFPTPVRRDMAEHAMFDLVPLAGAGRKVTDRQAQAGMVRPIVAKPPSTAVCGCCCCLHYWPESVIRVPPDRLGNPSGTTSD
jgi:hypothetical protein